jgi:ABC-type glycerol-3-phosphate transport system permease component
MRGGRLILALYLIALMLPIYWLVNMSFKTNTEITNALTLWPRTFTLRQLRQDLHRSELVQRLYQLAASMWR